MKTIFSRTLETTLKKISIVLFVLIGIGCGWFMIRSYGNPQTAKAFENYLNQCVNFQHLIVFFALDGVLLFCTVIDNGAGLIANEVHEGTFKLLAAKPNSRIQILCGKIVGAYIGCFLLMVLGILSYYSMIALSNAFDGNILKEMFSYVGVYILYGAIVILIVLSISVLLSCVMKRKVAALLPLLAVMIVIFGVFPFYRIINSVMGSTTSSLIRMLDLNYQFASVFKCIVEMKGKIVSNDMMIYATNLFTSKQLDADIIRMSSAVSVVVENTSINPTTMLATFMAAALAMFAGAFAIIRKKDI